MSDERSPQQAEAGEASCSSGRKSPAGNNWGSRRAAPTLARGQRGRCSPGNGRLLLGTWSPSSGHGEALFRALDLSPDSGVLLLPAGHGFLLKHTCFKTHRGNTARSSPKCLAPSGTPRISNKRGPAHFKKKLKLEMTNLKKNLVVMVELGLSQVGTPSLSLHDIPAQTASPPPSVS